MIYGIKTQNKNSIVRIYLYFTLKIIHIFYYTVFKKQYDLKERFFM